MALLSEAQVQAYYGYLNQAYIHARNLELGVPSSPPALPAGFAEILGTDSIKRLNAEMVRVKKKYKEKK